MTRKNVGSVTNRSFTVIPGWERPDKTGFGQNRWHIQAYSTFYHERVCDPLRNFPEPSIVQKFPGRGWMSFPPKNFSKLATTRETLRYAVGKRRRYPDAIASRSQKTPTVGVSSLDWDPFERKKFLLRYFRKDSDIYLFSKLNINFTTIK